MKRRPITDLAEAVSEKDGEKIAEEVEKVREEFEKESEERITEIEESLK